jgi:hypothetical protein
MLSKVGKHEKASTFVGSPWRIKVCSACVALSMRWQRITDDGFELAEELPTAREPGCERLAIGAESIGLAPAEELAARAMVGWERRTGGNLRFLNLGHRTFGLGRDVIEPIGTWGRRWIGAWIRKDRDALE